MPLVIGSDSQTLGNFLNDKVAVGLLLLLLGDFFVLFCFFEPFGSHLVYVNEMTQSGASVPEVFSRLEEG